MARKTQAQRLADILAAMGHTARPETYRRYWHRKERERVDWIWSMEGERSPFCYGSSWSIKTLLKAPSLKISQTRLKWEYEIYAEGLDYLANKTEEET